MLCLRFNIEHVSWYFKPSKLHLTTYPPPSPSLKFLFVVIIETSKDNFNELKRASKQSKRIQRT